MWKIYNYDTEQCDGPYEKSCSLSVESESGKSLFTIEEMYALQYISGQVKVFQVLSWLLFNILNVIGAKYWIIA